MVFKATQTRWHSDSHLMDSKNEIHRPQRIYLKEKFIIVKRIYIPLKPRGGTWTPDWTKWTKGHSLGSLFLSLLSVISALKNPQTSGLMIFYFLGPFLIYEGSMFPHLFILFLSKDTSLNCGVLWKHSSQQSVGQPEARRKFHSTWLGSQVLVQILRV